VSPKFANTARRQFDHRPLVARHEEENMLIRLLDAEGRLGHGAVRLERLRKRLLAAAPALADLAPGALMQRQPGAANDAVAVL
jgi:hypothetical protein